MSKKKNRDQQGYDFVRSRFVPGLSQPHPTATVNTNHMRPSFDDAHDELIPMVDRMYNDLGIDHRARRVQMEMNKIEEEILEFLRDPCPSEAIDVIFCLWSWCHYQQIDLPTLMHEKLVELRSRTWEVRPDGTLHHIEKEQQHAANPQ